MGKSDFSLLQFIRCFNTTGKLPMVIFITVWIFNGWTIALVIAKTWQFENWTIWKPDHLKPDLQKVRISNGWISDPHWICQYLLSMVIFLTFLLSWQPQRRQKADGWWPHFLPPPENIAETQQTKICLVTFVEKSFCSPGLWDSSS